MYRNLGHKIKTIAKVLRWVNFAAGEAVGAIMLLYNNPDFQRALIGAAIMALAPLLGWILSLIIYTIGHLVENSDIRTDLAIRQYAALRSAGPAAPKAAPVQGADAAQQSAPQQSAPQHQAPQAQQTASRPSWGQY
ncbi:MAG: hypothetical protein K5919_11235 [Clostridiales bacterium]|nr:hypothetical protein [Clostridiales bacterium]